MKSLRTLTLMLLLIGVPTLELKYFPEERS